MTTTQTPSKARTIPCVFCQGHPGRSAVEVTSGPCRSCQGYGLVSEHSLQECWCDGTESAVNHEEH
jgi:hypothetical protein